MLPNIYVEEVILRASIRKEETNSTEHGISPTSREDGLLARLVPNRPISLDEIAGLWTEVRTLGMER